MLGAEVGQDLGQHLGADDLAGGEADHAARGVPGPGRRADQGAGRPGHGLGVGSKVERGVGGLQALGRAGEQGHAQAALQFGDLATQGRLGQAQGPGGGRQAALGHHRQEGAVQAPVRIVHAFMHGRSRLFVNSRLVSRGRSWRHHPETSHDLDPEPHRPGDRRDRRHRRRSRLGPGPSRLDRPGPDPPRPAASRGRRMDRGRRHGRRRRGPRRARRGADRPRRQPARLQELGQAGPADDRQHHRRRQGGGRADPAAGHGLQFRPGDLPADRRDRPPGPDHPQGQDPGRDGAAAEGGLGPGRAGADRPGRRLLRAARRQQLVRPDGDQAGRAGEVGDRARRQGPGPCLGLSAGPGRDHGPAAGPRRPPRGVRGLSLRRPPAGLGRDGGLGAARDRQPNLPVMGFPWWLVVGLSPVVPVFREMAEMRYLWREPLVLDDRKLRAFLGEVPHTPLDFAVAASLRALGCLDHPLPGARLGRFPSALPAERTTFSASRSAPSPRTGFAPSPRR
jgi:hypothetical protein